MQVLVYGGGAVGLGLASCLLKAGSAGSSSSAGAAVHIVARAETVRALRAKGLLRTGLFGTFHAPPHAFTCSETLAEFRPACAVGAAGRAAAPCDYVLVCVKAPDSTFAAQDLAAHSGALGDGCAAISGETRVVIVQNGWGAHEVFAQRLPAERIYSARVITGFARPEPNHVDITVHADAITIGSLCGAEVAAVGPLCEAIARGGIPCRPSPDIGKDLWAKMLYNCALNPLGAIFGVPYGALARSEHTRDLMNAVFREVFAVMAASGYSTHWQRPEDYQEIFYQRLVPPTAAHESSMLQDIRAGKRTEIEAMNGAVVRLADAAGLDVPVNRIVYHMLRFLEAQATAGRAPGSEECASSDAHHSTFASEDADPSPASCGESAI